MFIISRFLETKTEYKLSQSTITIFIDTEKGNELNDSTLEDFFISEESVIYIFNNLWKKLSTGIDNSTNTDLRNIFLIISSIILISLAHGKLQKL